MCEIERKASVLVIGAGISGLYGAYLLTKKGFNKIIVLEAQSKIGGRIQSVSQECVLTQGLELGGQWIHGLTHSNPMWEFIKTYNIPVNYEADREPKGKFICTTAKTCLSDDLQSDMERFFEDAKESATDVEHRKSQGQSVGDYYDKLWKDCQQQKRPEEIDGSTNKLKRQFFDWMVLDEEKDCGCDNLHELSLADYANYTADISDDYADCCVVGGVRPTVVQKLIELLEQKGVRILTNHRVNGIDWSGESIKVTCENGATFQSNVALVTVSLGCLKAKHRAMFSPPLPKSKVDAIACLRMGSVEKVFVTFEEDLPNEVVDGFCLLWEEGVVERVRRAPKDHWYKSFNMFHEVNSRTLLTFITGPAARHMNKLSQDIVKDTIQKEIMDDVITPYLRGVKMPLVATVTRSEWCDNQDVLGGYSYAPKECVSPAGCRGELGKPLIDREGRVKVLFAGEALSPTNYGTMNAAMETAGKAVTLISNNSK